MSDQTHELEIPTTGGVAFEALMDTLVAEEEGQPAGQSEAPSAPAAGDAGAAGAEGDAAGKGAAPASDSASGDASSEADGDGGATDTPAADAGNADAPADAGGGTEQQPARGNLPATWTATAAELTPKINELSSAFEERTRQAYQQTALEEVRSEHKAYFEALEKHPRMLVGQQVPAIGKDGMETLRDANDAKDWQEAVKHLLVAEVRDKADKAMEESSEFLTTIHASIDLFTNNPDLVPGTRDFDVDLANRFAAMATPYELRVDGRLQGYSIPVQPLIEQIRNQLVKEREAKPAAPAAPAAPTPTPEPPQAGITSKAGAGSDAEDFSTLFGTIGLPNLQI